MNCVDVRRRLGKYLSEDLSPGEAEEISHHLKRCSACQRELKFLQNIGLLIAQREQVPIPPNLETDFLEKLQGIPLPLPGYAWFGNWLPIRASQWGIALLLSLVLFSLLLPPLRRREAISMAVSPNPALQTLIAWHKWSDQQGPVADTMTDLTLHTLANRGWPPLSFHSKQLMKDFIRGFPSESPSGQPSFSGPASLVWVSQR